MNCTLCREAISARLDGEGSPAAASQIEAHLVTCAGCRQFVEDAAHVTRLARTSVVVETPDVVAAVVAAAPRSHRAVLLTALRMLLGLVGVAQIAVAVLGALSAQAGGHTHTSEHLNGASLQHFAHETAAWNLGLGVGFCWVAWRSSRTSGMVPTLATFVLALTLLETLDLLAGQVDLSRMLLHCLVLLGLVLVIVLDWCRRPIGGTAPLGTSSGWGMSDLRPEAQSERSAEPPSPPDLRPSARHCGGAAAAHNDDPVMARHRTA